MQHLPGIAVLKDNDGRYLFVNEQWKRLSGCAEKNAWHLKSNHDIWPAQVAEQLCAGEHFVWLHNAPHQTIEKFIGGEFEGHWLINRFPVSGHDGEASYLGAVGINLTERLKAEEELKRSEELYRSLFNNMLNGFAYCRMLFRDGVPEDYIHLAVNPAFVRHTGLQDVIGRRITDVIPGIRESDSRLFEIYGRVAQSGRPERFEMFVDTLQMWFEISVFSPAPEHFVVVFDKIDDRKLAEIELSEKQAQLDAAVMELSMAEERERRRIAGELHDNVGQNLILSRLKLAMLADRMAGYDDDGTIQEINELIGRSVQDIRTLMFQLSPPLLDDIGLEASLAWLADKMRTDYGLLVRISDDGAPKPLAVEQRAAVFRAVRELLINVAKHAETHDASVCVSRIDRSMRVCVEDRGRGFAPDTLKNGPHRDGGFGLMHIRRRITHVGGAFTLHSAPGTGTAATITMPLIVQETRSMQ